MYAAILAGGVGTRLWPRSRQAQPKQFSDITGSGRTMIQATADRLAECADFLSFGTGDLSESFCGISRYDAALSFLPEYLSQGVFDQDPFQTIDQAGVGALMRIASEKVAGRRELGTCGAQAVHPASLQFCAELGLDYVSVPARHLPAVRLLAAQICLKQKSAPV